MIPSANYVSKMNEITKKYIEMVNSDPDGCWPSVVRAIVKFGADNIFMVSNEYHGRYEDDYAYFHYYNNCTGEFFKDTWTTAFACPGYGLYEHIYIDAADKEGLVNRRKLYTVIAKQMIENINNFTFDTAYNFSSLAGLGLKVTVNTGRKWKGAGFLIGTFTKKYQWGTPRWKSSSDYGVSSTTYAKILDPETNEINSVTAQNVKFVDMDAYVEEYKTEMLKRLNNTTWENLKIGDFSSSYSSHSGDHNAVKISIAFDYPNFLTWLAENHANRFNLTECNDIDENNKNKKLDELKKVKMPAIIDWVKTNTDKTNEDDILALAECIFNKHYKK